MKASRVLVAAGLVLFGSLCFAQGLAGVTPEMINLSLPLEGAPKAEPGAYAVTSELAFGNEGLKIFRPADLERFPKRDKLPVVVWGNGGCSINVGRHAGFLETVASHGFLVISTNAPAQAPAAPGAAPTRPRLATTEDQKAGIDWAEVENARAGSPLKGKVDTRHVALMGQSCGGRLALELGTDARVKTIAAFGAGLDGEQLASLQKLHGPVLLLNGGEHDFMMPPSKATFDAIGSVPVFYGSRHGAGHSSTIYHPGGGEFVNVASSWLRWQFKHDKKAAKMFVGKQCGLCTNANWDTESKLLAK